MMQAPENMNPAQKTVSHVLGEVTWLMAQSQLHKTLFIADLEWMVMPAILLEQFRLFYGANKQQPAGLIIWASISDETESRFQAGQLRLAPQEWRGGDNLWIIEMVAPFGGQQEMIDDLATTVFKGRAFKYQQTGPEGTAIITREPETATSLQ